MTDRPAPPPPADPGDEADDEATIVVDRGALDEATVVASRPPVVDDDATLVVDFAGDRAHDVDGEGRGALSPTPATRRDARDRASARRAHRTRIVLPDGATPSMRAAEGPGADAVDVYRPRPVPAPPADVVPPLDGPEATRLAAPSMPSVRRATRRAGVLALVCVAAACVVSVVGLVVLARLVFGG